MEIKNFKNIRKGCLTASFVVMIPEWGQMEFDCLYFEKGEQYWFNICPKEYTDQTGKKKSWNQLRWPEAIRERLTKTMREKLSLFLEKKPEVQQTFYNEDEIPF